VAHKVVFRDDAVANLTALYDYIADHTSPEIAIGYIRRHCEKRKRRSNP
jgi:plasmid stabilization system protein ParE